VTRRPAVRRALSLTRVGRELHVTEHVDDALAALAA
jgi:hypothetical protein